MGSCQGKVEVTADQAKEQKRMLNRAIRQIERERSKLQAQEAKTLKEIKKLATQNQHGAAKIMAKDLVRSRTQVNMYYTMASHMKAIQSQMAATGMNAQMLQSLKGCTSVMQNVNASMNIQDMNKVMKNFAMETEKMGLQQEMMQDQFDMVADPDADAQADEIYGQILGEIGMDMNSAFAAG